MQVISRVINQVELKRAPPPVIGPHADGYEPFIVFGTVHVKHYR